MLYCLKLYNKTKQKNHLGMVLHACNPAFGSLGQDGTLQTQSQPGLHTGNLP